MQRTRVTDTGTSLVLNLAQEDRDLYGEAVERRHAALAAKLTLKAKVASD